MRHGNCLFYAILRKCHDWRGRLHMRLLRWHKPWKLRFYYEDADGVWWRFAPDHPKRGWKAWPHSLWFAGHEKRLRAARRNLDARHGT